MRFVFTLFVLSSVTLCAQTFSFGVKGGGLLTEPAERFDQSRRYVVGPVVEVLSPWKVALEVDAFYSRFGSSLSLQGTTGGRTRGDSWQLPILGKYYFKDRTAKIRPFASSGFSLRKTWFEDRSFRDGRPGQRRTNGFDSTSDLGVGAVVAGGFDADGVTGGRGDGFVQITLGGGPQEFGRVGIENVDDEPASGEQGAAGGHKNSSTHLWRTLVRFRPGPRACHSRAPSGQSVRHRSGR